MSVLISRSLDRTGTGTADEVNIRRTTQLVMEQAFQFGDNFVHRFYGGSRAEGFYLPDSDHDRMLIDTSVTVLDRGQSLPPRASGQTVLYMVEAAGCRPGYVSLVLADDQLDGIQRPSLMNSLVQSGNMMYVSSDIYREQFITTLNRHLGDVFKSSGPSCSTASSSLSVDLVYSFACSSWPEEANEWTSRERLSGWPRQSLIDRIVRNGCHIVPKGDNCSGDTLLQWMISFVSAERMLVHSFNHVQFKVYFLLKHFLRQVKVALKTDLGDEDILCSYFLKTLLFHAIESSDELLWRDKNLYVCFWFCFNILIAWVKAKYCPHYFIPANNLFQRKIHGQNQQRLLVILNDYLNSKWGCLRLEQGLSLVMYICQPHIQDQLLQSEPVIDIVIRRDLSILQHLRTLHYPTRTSFKTIVGMFNLSSKSESEYEEILTYYYGVHLLYNWAIDQVFHDHTAATGNKNRYQNLKRSKRFIIPRASVGTELLYLATFYFRVGNFTRSLEISRQTMRLAAYFLHDTNSMTSEQRVMYAQVYGFPGGTSINKLQNLFTSYISFEYGQNNLCLPELQPEISVQFKRLDIPPLPYAVFLSFLCCHELGDIPGRATALRNLIVLKDDPFQGGHKYWIVHNLLGICYTAIWDIRRALRCYEDSTQMQTEEHEFNPATLRIEVLRKFENE